MKTISKIIYVLLVALFVFFSCSVDNPLVNDNQQQEEEEEQVDTHTLSDLQGRWIRTGGNNTNNEGMIIEVTNNQGLVIDPVDSGFAVEDVKWMNIIDVETTGFTHMELGSDSNYYSATIEFQSDNVIWISVDAAGAGNYQEWTRQ